MRAKTNDIMTPLPPVGRDGQQPLKEFSRRFQVRGPLKGTMTRSFNRDALDSAHFCRSPSPGGGPSETDLAWCIASTSRRLARIAQLHPLEHELIEDSLVDIV